MSSSDCHEQSHNPSNLTGHDVLVVVFESPKRAFASEERVCSAYVRSLPKGGAQPSQQTQDDGRVVIQRTRVSLRSPTVEGENH